MIADQIREKRHWYSSLALLAEKVGVHNNWTDALKDRATELGVDEVEVYEVIDIDDEVYLNYAAHDIFQVSNVYHELDQDQFADHPLTQVETSISVLYAILRMRGVNVDYDLLEEVMVEKDQLISEYIMKLGRYGVYKLFSGNDIHAAIERTGLELPSRTRTGRPKMDKGILQGVMVSGNKKAMKIAKLVTEGRSHKADFTMLKQLSDNMDPYGRVHPDIRGIGAITSRSTCKLPNLQQVNKTTGDPRVRRCLLPRIPRKRKGKKIVYLSASADYSGVEVRAIGDVAEDKKLRKKVLRGDDVHGELAVTIYTESYTPRQRARCKNGIFAMLYGASDISMASQIGCSVKQAVDLREAWESTYTQVTKASKKWTKKADVNGFIELPSGWITSTIEMDDDDEEQSTANPNTCLLYTSPSPRDS